MRRRALLAGLPALALAAALGGCGALSPAAPPPPCPPILVLKDTSRLVRFEAGPGRDVTDVVFEAAIADFRAVCDYDRDDAETTIALDVVFDVRRGPAAAQDEATFDYFVAIPHFYPAPQGKRVFRTRVAFEGNRARLRYRDRIDLTIPIDPERRRDTYTIYLGFQLTESEIEENRRRAGR